MNLWTSLNRNARISLIVVTFIGLFILFGFPGLNSDWFQFTRNYEINDNSQNWANHNYGYNLMKSAEPNSVFMTEGGDNQVFSLLYFATAERKRLDIDFFDQKGNVFPRLYGDLLNTHPEEIELIRNIRDYQLFSTGRPIYLTWQRPNLEKLNIITFRQQKKQILSKFPKNQQNIINNKYRLDTLEQFKSTARNMIPKSVYDLTLRSGGNLAEQDFRYLGPWYLKNFGMVFRVTPLRYAIVDALERLNDKGNFSTINPIVRKLSKLVMIPQQFSYYVNQLEDEGYVKRVNDDILLVKPFRGKFDHSDSMALWDKYQFSYLEAPNAHNWDFLTREIFANTVRTKSDSINIKIETLQSRLNYESDSDRKNTILQEFRHWNQSRNDIRKTITKYNYDNPGMTYSYALEMQKQNNIPEAIRLFVMTARANYHYSQGFLQAIEYTLNLAEKDSKNQVRYLNEARGYLVEFYRTQDIYSAMTGKLPQQNSLNIARNLEQKIQGIQNISMEEIKILEQDAGDDIGKLNKLVRLYRERGNHNRALEVMEKIQKLEPFKFDHYFNLIDFAKGNRLDVAIKYANEAIMKYDQLQGEKPPIWELEYYRGNIFFNYANTVIAREPENRSQIRAFLNQAKQGISKFLNNYKTVVNSSDNSLRQKANNAEKIIERIDVLLKKHQ